jgi:hypothetical protein
MTETKTSTRPPEEPTKPTSRLLEMSATQLIGGALAAMTAAVIGARLGVAGTVLGAAIGSVVAGAAGSIYTASLKHTKQKLTSAFVGRVGGTPVEVTTVSTDTTAVRSRAADGWPADGWTVPEPTAATAPPSPDPVAAAAEIDAAGRPTTRWPWKAVLVSTAAVFLLAIAGITAFELVSGQAVSGGQGTTLTQVGEGRSGGTAPSEAPSAETSTSPTAEPSSTPSTEPSAAPSSEPTATSEPSTTTSQTPAPSTSTPPSSTPSPSASTSAGAGGEADGTDTGTAGG